MAVTSLQRWKLKQHMPSLRQGTQITKAQLSPAYLNPLDLFKVVSSIQMMSQDVGGKWDA